MGITEEQEYAVGGSMSEDGLNTVLDLIDEYVELVESLDIPNI